MNISYSIGRKMYSNTNWFIHFLKIQLKIYLNIYIYKSIYLYTVYRYIGGGGEQTFTLV